MLSPTTFTKNKSILTVLTILSGTMLSGTANAGAANFDSASSTLHIQAVDVDANTFDATLTMIKASEPFQFDLIDVKQIAQPAGERAVFNTATNKVIIPSVTVDNGSDEFIAELELVPGSNPMRFTVTKLEPGAKAVANFDSATSTLRIKAIDIPVSASKANTVDATLKLIGTNPFLFELTNSAAVAQPAGERAHFDPVVNKVFIPKVTVDNGGAASFAELELVPGSNPMRFAVRKLHSTEFTGCPEFSQPLGENACLLSGSITQDVTLSNEILWVLAGGVDIGGDNAQPATLTIEPDTRIVGQSGADFLYINRGSKINAVGTPQHPIVFTGPADDDSGSLTPGAWGGLVIAGNAPVNGCNTSVAVCVQFDEALTRPYGGNAANENSGILKYAQIRYAGNQIRPDQELNALTLLGVGSGTTIDFVQLHRGSDDGIEMFGGTVNFKHVVSTGNSDDSVDWGQGWTGKAQYVLIKQIEDDGDNGIEADNNEGDFNSLPRSKPMLANITAIGTGNPGIGGDGALLRRGTGANISNSVFTGFRRSCLNIDSDATFQNAGTPSNLTGQLTMVDTYVDCTLNFNEQPADPFLVSDWFLTQQGNEAADPKLNDFLPAVGSPLISAGAPVADSFFDATSYSGAFADENDNWTKGWTFGLN
ncbi:hypothetical protein [Methylobacter sp. YRD-M1]|uniref:hypothetical protein n=1 Tax=Methylobacter sp. YRD-M1 TaxID=2911520 RepID=UPI00227B219B|nr:hypothetical protein [Methylobacter sp. YRD-M1]WAK01434.1 hypothetical protein LZ558_16610 [Methylobacter sp. YRD-M1]